MSYPIWVGVQTHMQSALAAAKTVTAITKGSPGVAASVAHGFSNGDYYLLETLGMYETNERIFRAAGIAADAFSLEGEDTTNYGTFGSGTAKKITFGISLSTLATVNGTGGESKPIDITTIHDEIEKTMPGRFSASEFTFDSHWDLSDPGFQEAIKVSKVSAQRAFMFTFKSGEKMLFYGYLSASGLPTGSAGDVVKTQVTIRASGLPTYYST